MTDIRKAMRAALEALEAQHHDRTAYIRARISANVTCAEFKDSLLSSLIESGYMQSMGKQTQAAIEGLSAALAQPERPVAELWQHDETGHTCVVMHGDAVVNVGHRWRHVGALYLRAAQPEQQAEPVAWMYVKKSNGYKATTAKRMNGELNGADEYTEHALYLHPPAQPQADTIAVPRELLTALNSALRQVAQCQEDWNNMDEVDALLAGSKP